jgi:1,4-dihydroxy-2-naphthoate octaprenyltransferase
MSSFRLFIRLARPHFLVGGFLLYALGVGIARYLGRPVDWGVYILGQAWVTMVQLGAQFLNEYFDAEGDTANDNRTWFSGGSGAVGAGRLSRNAAVLGAAVSYTIVAVITGIMIRNVHPDPAAWLIMAIAFLASFFYSAPPLKLENTGYGELTTSILVANMVPAFAFILQSGGLHRLVAMTTFPLTALHLSMLLAFELADYPADIKAVKRTLMVRLNWQNGMLLHNILILGAYFLLALAIAFGLPIRIALPAFFTLPLGLLEIWQMRRIAEGMRPNWTALTLNAVVLFFLTAYLLTFSFWIR